MAKSKERKKREPRAKAKFDGVFKHAWVKATPAFPKAVQYAERLKKGLSLLLYVAPDPHAHPVKGGRKDGRKTWRVLFYNEGKPISEKIGSYCPGKSQHVSVAAARDKADEFDPEVAIASEQAGTFKTIAEDWIVKYVDKKKLRTKPEIERKLKTYVYPRWGNRLFFDISRLDVNDLLDRIETNHGMAQADAVLATVRKLMDWYQSRNGKYTSPIVKGMNRDQRSLAQRSRHRALDHVLIRKRGKPKLEWKDKGEIRAVWAACDEVHVLYGGLLRMLLLTGQRESKVAHMKRSDLVDGYWVIETADREKGNADKVKLPKLALDVIYAMPEIEGNPYVFPASKGDGPFNSFSQRKAQIDQKLKEMEHWTLHDLRRTARSIMSRIGISREVAERTLGHMFDGDEKERAVGSGVEGVYDVFDYTEQKSDALQRLAVEIARILSPANVVPLRKPASA